MSDGIPRVTIGLPVFNAERYLAETLDALLAQTFADFELVIADNASTDGTGAICQAYAARDGRIRYYRNARNIGGARNYNRVFGLARGAYFKWAAHDDLCGPTYLERCVAVLDQQPEVAFCWPQARIIDAEGRVVESYRPNPRVHTPDVAERFLTCITMAVEPAVFGLIRRDILRQTRLIGTYAASDRILVGELALHGRCYEIPEPLFFYRHHAQQSWRVYPTLADYQRWFDPTRGSMALPHWRLLLEHFISVSRGPLSWRERGRCCLALAWWGRRNWRYLLNNLLMQDTEFRGRPLLRQLYERVTRWQPHEDRAHRIL